jgi:hypothetical protein
VQCIRTYLYTGAVLVPQQAEHEAVRQAGNLSNAARAAGITDPRMVGPVLQRSLESASDRVLWMRVLGSTANVVAQAGKPLGKPEGLPKFQAPWYRMGGPAKLGTVVDTPQGQALVVMLPLRMPHAFDSQARPDSHGPPPDDHRGPYVLEVAISLKAVGGAFQGLQQNLIVGLIASLALLVCVAVIGLRAPHYLRGKYLESELKVAKRVQGDLQPKSHAVPACVEFTASAVAADHVGGDFFDVFEADSGKVGIVLGDVSGKGVPAALLVSVLHGAIRSSIANEHELACGRINRMLCERTACERFATLFWAVFDPASGTLRYVNAGHGAPMLVRRGRKGMERLCEGGPVLGLLSGATYEAGTVEIEDSDTLILYSDGISEATNQKDEEFGEDRVTEIVSSSAEATTETICKRIVSAVNAFASAGPAQDDRTLMVIRFSRPVVMSAVA